MAVDVVAPRVLHLSLEPTAPGDLDLARSCAEIPALTPDKMSIVVGPNTAVQRQP